jgi:hypothetical protein
MGATYRFLATVEEAGIVLDWFRARPESPVENPLEFGSVFYFRVFGTLDPDPHSSPLVNVFVPRRKRGVLTTIGEVHFLAMRFPGLKKTAAEFRMWLQAHPRVYSHHPDFTHEWDYFLEGSAKNWDSDIFAFPAGMAALQRGDYFVSDDDNESVLDKVCRALELRGVEGIEPE